MNKEEFAYKIVEGYDMDTVIDSAVQGILTHWDKYPEDLKWEIDQRQDILNNEKVEEEWK